MLTMLVAGHTIGRTCFFLPRRACFGAPALARLVWRASPGTPTLARLAWRPRPGAPVLARLLCRSYFGAPSWPRFACRAFFGAPSLARFGWCASPGAPLLGSWNSLCLASGPPSGASTGRVPRPKAVVGPWMPPGGGSGRFVIKLDQNTHISRLDDVLKASTCWFLARHSRGSPLGKPHSSTRTDF